MTDFRIKLKPLSPKQREALLVKIRAVLDRKVSHELNGLIVQAELTSQELETWIVRLDAEGANTAAYNLYQAAVALQLIEKSDVNELDTNTLIYTLIEYGRDYYKRLFRHLSAARAQFVYADACRRNDPLIDLTDLGKALRDTHKQAWVQIMLGEPQLFAQHEPEDLASLLNSADEALAGQLIAGRNDDDIEAAIQAMPTLQLPNSKAALAAYMRKNPGRALRFAVKFAK